MAPHAQPVGKPSGWYRRRARLTRAVINLAWLLVGTGAVIGWYRFLPGAAITAAAMVLALWVRVYAGGLMVATAATIAEIERRGCCGQVLRTRSGKALACELAYGHSGRCSYAADITAAVERQP